MVVCLLVIPVQYRVYEMSRRKRLSQQRKSGSPRKQQNVPEMKKYPCGHCEKEVKDQEKSVECDYCNKWYHITCESIKPADYDKLTTLKSLDQLMDPQPGAALLL